MTEVVTTTQLNGTARLWRYMSLDKLVDLFSTSELHFAPLASFVSSDPFEGYLPATALAADAEVFRNGIRDTELSHTLVEKYRNDQGHPLTCDERRLLQGQVTDLKTLPRRVFRAMAKATVVNCWHANETESEAMWRLYSENGKAVAIETSLCSLRKSIESRESPHRVHIYPVKYLDFFDPKIEPRECVVEGHRVPLLKRKSYEHEHEVRAFISKVSSMPANGANIDPVSVRLPFSPLTLIEAVHVSPYAGEPFPSSVKRICELFGLGSDIVKPSKLLRGDEELLDRLNL